MMSDCGRELLTCPTRLRQHLPKQDLGVVRVEQGYGVCVPRIVGRRVHVVQRIQRIWLRAVLGEVESLVMLELVGRGFKEERCVR
jgi:hypothetical protein